MANKTAQQDRYRLSGTYERLRRDLLELPTKGRLEKPLAYWVQPTDRRLPIAFLDVPLNDLLSRRLEDLMSTPGVGQKKILGFFDLLRRAAKNDSLGSSFGMKSEDSPVVSEPGNDSFSQAEVSEAVWSRWCETVNRCGFREESLGRLAQSLRTLPTVIWRAPVKKYADRSLADIKQLKTHGSKRVGAVLEVFRMVHEAASVAVVPETIDLCLAPRFIRPVTRWLLQAAAQPAEISIGSVRHRLVAPLIAQTKIDLGGTIANLIAKRLRSEKDKPTVKKQADDLGVTRARVYQLIEEAAEAIDIRWPEGRWLLHSVAQKTFLMNRDAAALFQETCDLYFPTERSHISDQHTLCMTADG